MELAEHIHARFEAQEADRTAKLLELREPLLQFSFQSSSTYTSESASEALRVLGATLGSSRMVSRQPEMTYSDWLPLPERTYSGWLPQPEMTYAYVPEKESV